MGTFTQEKRLLQITSVLGTDVLLLTGFSGTEEMSRLFTFQLDLLSENETIAATDLVGTNVTWSVNPADETPRYFNGMVSRLVAGGITGRSMRAYQIEVVPKLWFLTRTTNCKIYQNMSTPDIVKAVLNDFGVTDLQVNVTGTYNPREYCVQYRETAFNFISRLMEEEGIFYFFQHDNGKHTLAIADANSAFQDVTENQLHYRPGQPATHGIHAWDHQYQYRSGVVARTDYNFETPSTSLLSSTNTILTLQNISSYELFDYPGLFMKKADGTAVCKVRMGEDEAPYNQALGASMHRWLSPGGKIELQDHEVSAENGKYVLTAVRHTGSEAAYGSGAGGSSYDNTFTCIPDSVTYRPTRVTPKPFVQGIQTAVVVGKSGEEIYVDKYGRVKVQFFWDRLGNNDENSSCWVRVAQVWAGKNWGVIFNPRIGQEVVVDFLEGDPDRPLITGRVYNADQMPPYTLPDNMTQSGVKSRSSKSGTTDNFNELRFEDKKDSELIYFHAEKDFQREVENNDTLTVGIDSPNTPSKGDRTVQIYNNHSVSVGTGKTKADEGSETIDIFNSQKVTVGSGAGQAKEGSQTISVYKDRTTSIETGNESLEVKQGNRTVTIDTGNDTHEVKTGNREVNIDTGNDTLTVKVGNHTVNVNAGKSSTTAVQSITLTCGAASIKIEPSAITLACGPSQIKLDPSSISLQGMMIKLAGQAQTQVQGTMLQLKGDAMLQASGGILMLG